MLALLTGDVQIGKTRWLEAVIAQLRERQVPSYGVLAPGRWVPSGSPRADGNGFEKTGIDNILLPTGKRIPFAQREDLARAAGAFDPASQSGQARLAWHIDDEAIKQVNAYLGEVPSLARAGAPGLLVIDELGRLELMAGKGLTNAVGLLRRGPSPHLPHGVVVVRDYLLDEARRVIGGLWGEPVAISPDAASEALLLGLFCKPGTS